MRRNLLIVGLIALGALAWGNDPNEVLRLKEDTFKPLKATSSELAQLHKVDEKFGGLLAKLRKQHPSDYLIKRDLLNEQYTKDFMTAMSPIQKSTYRKYIRSLRQGYIKAHPLVDADNIFIWGGANLL